MSSSIKTLAKAIKFFSLFIIALLLIIWLSSPFVSRHYLTKYLNEHQLTLADKTTIRYNPFWSNLNIRELEIVSVENSDKPLISLKSLNVTLSLFKLLTDTLFVSEFAIDGLYLDVNLNGESPIIGGFVIANNSNETKKSVETPAAQTADLAKDSNNEVANNYQVSLPYFSLSNATFNVGIEQSQQEFIINSLVIKNVLASTKTQQAEVVLNALINKAPLLLKLNADLTSEQRKISSEITLSELALAPLQPLLTANITEQEPLTMQGSISLNSKQSISLSTAVTDINVETFELKATDFKATQKNKTLALNIFPLTLENFSLVLVNEQAPKINGTASLNINDLKAYEGEGAQLLAKISTIKLDDITVTTTESLITASIKNLIIEQSLFAENTTDNFPPLAQFKNLSINDVTVSQQGLFIDTINLLGLTIDTNLDKEKNITGLPTSPKDQPPVAEPIAKTINSPKTIEGEAGSEEKLFLLSLNSFSFGDTAGITFIDRSTSPYYKRSFNITTFNAGPFDNQKPQQESNFTLTGNSDKYANFNLSAVAKPFSKKDYYKLNGFFKEVSLPSLSTYIAQALNYELKSGQLDVDLDVTIDDKKIAGKTKLFLRGVELGAANDHETGTVKSQTSVPFNIALGMLKDGDGNVELDIPLKGSTDDPSFGMSGFINLLVKKATMSAAKEYLITTFVPYANVVNVAMSAGDYLLKVRFNDLNFPIKETQLTAQQSQFLAQFSALMTDKLDTQLTLCAIATPEDIDKPLGTKITDIDDIKQLAEISGQRLEAFKDYMVKEHGIASSRLLLCSPKIDSTKGAKPRITFTD
jgi:hypothetical protein